MSDRPDDSRGRLSHIGQVSLARDLTLTLRPPRGIGDQAVLEDVASVVYPVLGHALEVRSRLRLGEPTDLISEQATFERLLAVESEARRYSDLASEFDIRYALACWLDELFIIDSPWASSWNERKLEVTLFSSNERAWRFWEKARRALSRAETDALEVFYLTVMLGFRGELRDRPEELRAWAAAARERLAREQARAWTPPPDLEPPSRVPPLRRRDGLRLLIARASVVLVLAIPPVVFAVVRLLVR